MNQNVLPSPGTLRAPMSPPIAVTSWREIARPSPVPPWVRVVDASAWRNGSNSRSIWSWRMPIPESVTSTPRSTPAGSAPATYARTATWPTLVNLIALEIRLDST